MLAWEDLQDATKYHIGNLGGKPLCGGEVGAIVHWNADRQLCQQCLFVYLQRQMPLF